MVLPGLAHVQGIHVPWAINGQFARFQTLKKQPKQPTRQLFDKWFHKQQQQHSSPMVFLVGVKSTLRNYCAFVGLVCVTRHSMAP